MTVRLASKDIMARESNKLTIDQDGSACDPLACTPCGPPGERSGSGSGSGSGPLELPRRNERTSEHSKLLSETRPEHQIIGGNPGGPPLNNATRHFTNVILDNIRPTHPVMGPQSRHAPSTRRELQTTASHVIEPSLHHLKAQAKTYGIKNLHVIREGD